MSWTVEILDRKNGRFLNSPNACTPINLSWEDLSGPDKALIRCPSDHLGIADWQTRLGQDVRVYDPQGRLAWWGYLDQVIQVNGELHNEVGMKEVANRVAVRYKDLSGSDPNEFRQTAWVEDLESQSVFGVKELLYQAGQILKDHADWVAAVLLKDKAWPEVILGPGVLSLTNETDACYLHCRGWMQSLSWRIWPGVSALVLHAPFQQGTQPVGDTFTRMRLAQSFLVKDALQFNRLAVRARKQGNPTDSLRFSLQPDLGGKPSGIELGFQPLNTSELNAESYGWVEVVLDVGVSLTPGTPYWLVLERSGGVNSGNYYMIGLDENQGYPDGTLLVYDQSSGTWNSRLPGADLIFRLSGLRDQLEQMRDVVSFAGQFLHGFEANIGQSIALSPLGDEGQNCLEVLRFLIMQGNIALEPLCAGIDPNRKLQVWKRPEITSASYSITSEGRLQTRFGQPLESPWQAVGQWLLAENSCPLYLPSLTLEPIRGRVRFNQK